MVSTIKYPVERVINWYWGNFCTRKCFNKEERLKDCYQKFELFKKKNTSLLITHKEFKDLIDNDYLLICQLPSSFRGRTVGWKQFEYWLRDPNFDADKVN